MPTATIQSLDRGLEILELVAASEKGLALHELAETLQIAPPTAFGLAGTLVARGYLEKSRRPIRYVVGPRLGSLTKSAGSGSQPRGAEMLKVRALLDADTVLFTKWIGGECLKAAVVDAVRPEVMQFPQTLIDSPYSMATSLCVLAFLADEDRRAYDRRYPFEEYGARLWSSRASLETFLQEVRATGVSFPSQAEVGRVAIPVFGTGNQLMGSLGASFRHPLVAGSEPMRQACSALKTLAATGAFNLL